MFNTLLVQPIYNLFIWLIGLVPGGDAGVALIVLTLIMRVVLYPMFTAQIRMQMGMQAMQGEMAELKEKHKNDREAHARAQLALYKKHNFNPFAGIGATILQLIVLFALYFALFHAQLPAVDTAFLYSFVPAPDQVSTSFFGLVDLLTPHHLILAVLVGATQYVAIWLTLRRSPAGTHLSSEQEAMQRMQQKMMLYVLPAVMTVTSYFFAGAVGLYFLVSNLFTIGQEWYIRRKQTTQN